MLPHPLTNSEIVSIMNTSNRVQSRNNLSEIQDGAYNIANLDEFMPIESHWIALYVNGNNIILFDRFGVQHIPKEIKKLIGN